MSAPAGWDVLDTTVGPAVVLHRLAVAIECRDAITDRAVGAVVTGRYRRLGPRGPLPWQPLPVRGRGQFVLRHAIPDDPARPLPRLELVLDDPTRAYAPRRVSVTPWTHAQVAEPAPYVDARSRLLRVWLSPGAAYQLPRTTSLVRGQVLRADGTPARWARVRGTTPTSVAGWAHADDRGEFLLVITRPGVDASHDFSPIVVQLTAYARPAGAVDPQDRTGDLVVEPVARSANPPAGPDLDSNLLRGTALPPGYLASTTPGPSPTVPFGAGLHLTQPIIVTP